MDFKITDLAGTCSMVEVHNVRPEKRFGWTLRFIELVRAKTKSNRIKVAIYNSNTKLRTWLVPGIRLVARYKGNNWSWSLSRGDFQRTVYVYLIEI